jgi:hypothetical protein
MSSARLPTVTRCPRKVVFGASVANPVLSPLLGGQLAEPVLIGRADGSRP